MAKTVIVKVKRVRDGAMMPTQGSGGAAGWDLYAEPENGEGHVDLWPGEIIKVRTGITLEIPPGWEGQIRPRSGLATSGVFMVNGPGTIDSDYRGEVMVVLSFRDWRREPMLPHGEKHELNVCAASDDYARIFRHDRIAQIVFQRVSRVALLEVDELSETPRGDGGFGSTGR
jgi:dUTP pyrophosphatase